MNVQCVNRSKRVVRTRLHVSERIVRRRALRDLQYIMIFEQLIYRYFVFFFKFRFYFLIIHKMMLQKRSQNKDSKAQVPFLLGLEGRSERPADPARDGGGARGGHREEVTSS